MAKVMFVVCFPHIQMEEEQANERDVTENKNNNEDSAHEHEKMPSECDAEDESVLKDNISDNVNNTASENAEEQSEHNSLKDVSEINYEGSSNCNKEEEHTNSQDDNSTNSVNPLNENDSRSNNASPNSKEKDISNADKETPNLVRFLSQELTLLESVKQTLEILGVTGVQWNLTDDNMNVCMFLTDYGAQCELIIKRLSMLNIGIAKNSSISVFPASICVEDDSEEEEETYQESDEKVNEKVSGFRKSIKSRLVVDQVVTSVEGDAVFTFDFLMLVILASVVAVMGLLESSSVVLVASMLISPLMGPILAIVFGIVIWKADLVILGAKNELIGLGICILVGFILGFIPAGMEAGKHEWRSSLEWPTIEMSSRGAWRSLLVGILIAIPSGAGVALSILGGKIGSLVGVAISASLLPPAVNAGLLWANAIVAVISPPQAENNGKPNTASNNSATFNTTASPHMVSSNPDCSSLLNNDYMPLHSCNIALDSFILGFVSLSLTILNIVCIIAMGILVLKLKEVAPLFHTTVRESEKDFFSKDLKVARESYATTKGKSAAAMRQQWLKEYKDFRSPDKADDNDLDAEQDVDMLIESVQDSRAVNEIVEKMPRKPVRWSQVITPSRGSSNSDASSRFAFPSPSVFDREEFELAERFVTSPRNKMSSSLPTTPKTGSEKAVYFTVHKFIHPRSLSSQSKPSSYYKKGKFHEKLQLPQSSRFMIAKIEDPPEIQRQVSKLSTLQEENGQQASDKVESEPLLT